MKRILLSCFSGLCLAASGMSFADGQFPCPTPEKLSVTPNYAVLYAPDLTSGMPANLAGNNGTGVSAAFSGLITGPSLYRIDNIAFNAVEVLTTNSVSYAVYCIYSIKGADKNNNPVSGVVYLIPGNSSYIDLYNYSLANGQEYSYDNSALIIAKNK